LCTPAIFSPLSRQSSPICVPLSKSHSRREPSHGHVMIRRPPGRCAIHRTRSLWPRIVWMGVTADVFSCFLLVWEDMVGAGGLKYTDRAVCIRKKPSVIFKLEQVACQRQIFLASQYAYLLSLQLLLIEVHKPLFTEQPAYSNHPEVNFETVRVAGVILERKRFLRGLELRNLGICSHKPSLNLRPTPRARHPHVC
jgi:hypothetical protein